eukprot:7538089-Ditylum_brightwellii.AAC.1
MDSKKERLRGSSNSRNSPAPHESPGASTLEAIATDPRTRGACLISAKRVQHTTVIHGEAIPPERDNVSQRCVRIGLGGLRCVAVGPGRFPRQRPRPP